jgi:hypothetical protein
MTTSKKRLCVKVGQVLVAAYLVCWAVAYNHFNPTPSDSTIPEDMLVTHGIFGVVPFLKSLVWPFFLIAD